MHFPILSSEFSTLCYTMLCKVSRDAKESLRPILCVCVCVCVCVAGGGGTGT
jgi:hypothetical protein